jgi:hypothetical protein
MTPTTTLPTLRDAMTAAELTAHQRHMAELLGSPGGAVFVLSGGGTVGLMLQWNNNTRTQHFRKSTWPEAITAAYAWLATRPVIARAERVRQMALAIIDIKDQDGSVKEWRLHARDFTAAEIAELGAEACARAGEMCAGAPFEIVR